MGLGAKRVRKVISVPRGVLKNAVFYLATTECTPNHGRVWCSKSLMGYTKFQTSDNARQKNTLAVSQGKGVLRIAAQGRKKITLNIP